MEKQKVIQCLYCGNKTLMNEVGYWRKNWAEDEGYYGYFKYYMYNCPICDKVTFYREYSDCAMQTIDENGDIVYYADEEILYPINTFNSRLLPTSVKEAYESTLKTKNIDKDVCLVALRMTIERICKDKKCKGKNLEQKIEFLYSCDILPKELKKASKIAKFFGNMGAHGDKTKLTDKEIDDLISFVEYIIEYIYVLPQKIQELEGKMNNL